MIDVTPHADGSIIRIKAETGARHDAIHGVHGGLLKVSVTQAAEKGKANTSIVALLAKSFGLRKSQLDILSGYTSPNKRLLVRGVSTAEFAKRIADFLNG